MADKKISQLTSASTPLAGTEVLPIVQSGSTVKVASDDLTVKNVRSNATTGILQVAGPGTGATRVMTTPNANFTAARTDAAQTFTGEQTFASGAALTLSGTSGTVSLQVPYPAASNAKSQLLFTGTGDFRQTLKIKLNKDQADNAPVDVMQFGPGTDVTVSAGNLVIGAAGQGIYFSSGGLIWLTGTGTPQSVVTAPVGSLFTRTDGGANTTLYVKESGAGNTGWVAK